MNEDKRNRQRVAMTKLNYPPGTRIELINMDDAYAPVPPGTRGTVVAVDDAGSIHMKWDNGRTLAVIPGEDQFRKLTAQEIAAENGSQQPDAVIKEGAEILQDNCQDTIFGGFAPNSKTAETLSNNLGNRTVLSGQVTRSKDSPSESLQMMQRPLMTPDELKSMPKGSFVVMKTGSHPMKVKLKLFCKWGIRFGEPLIMPDQGTDL